MSVRTPLTIIAVLLAVFVAGAVAFGGGSSAKKRGSSVAAVAAEVRRIAARDEVIRGLRFKHVPAVRIVTPAQAEREGLADFRHSEPPAAQARGTELLELLGLLPVGTSLTKIEGAVYGGQVAGYYDPRTKKLSIVSGHGAEAAGGADAEITLSHELNHALEDQSFGIHEGGGADIDDRGSAYTAMIEGTATEVMTRYALRYIGAARTLSGSLGSLDDSSTAGLPPYVLASLLFPYEEGQKFVEALVKAGGWKLVDYAERTRPPASTEQIIHPALWLENQRPLPVTLPDVGSVLGAGWRRVESGSIGELDTDQLLKIANPALVAGDAAAGWGGGRYELWHRGPLPAPGCAAPCRARDALVLSWRWDTPGDLGEFMAAARAYVLKRAPLGAGVALGSSHGVATIAFAPTPALAGRLAGR